MRRRRTIALASCMGLTFVSALVACASLVVPEIETTTRPPPEAGPPVGVDGSTQDPCAHAVPPPQNGDDNPTLDVGELSFVIRETHLEKTFGYDASVFGDAAPPPNTILGFDLDNDCTCEPGLPHDGGANSCRPAVGNMACDQPNGIDNQLPALLLPLKVLTQSADLDTLATINSKIVAGDSAIGIVVRGYNGLANDKEVTVLIHGLTRPNRLPFADGGDICINAAQRPPSFPPADDPDAADGATYDPDRLPLFDGCDEWGDLSGTPALPAYVANHVLVVGAEVSVPFPFAGTIVNAESVKMTALLVPEGTGGWTLEDGVIGGRGPVTALLVAGGTLSFSKDAGPICLDPSVTGQFERTSILTNFCPAVDINAHSSQDFYVAANGLEVACDAISLAFAFRGERAFVGAAADGGSRTNCADAGLVCPILDGGH